MRRTLGMLLFGFGAINKRLLCHAASSSSSARRETRLSVLSSPPHLLLLLHRETSSTSPRKESSLFYHQQSACERWDGKIAFPVTLTAHTIRTDWMALKSCQENVDI
jgi:hypothetical protein